MTINSVLGTALTAVTNPNPNTLGTVSPYSLSVSRGVRPFSPSAAWTSQGNLALFVLGSLDGRGDIPIRLRFVPSSAGATYTVTVWTFDPNTGAWGKPFNQNSNTYTGEEDDFINDPGGYGCIFLQLSNISAGTVSIYFDSGNARVG